ncbi:MAG: EamA family transporter [Bacillus sp. (in: Bacteria)]|nr:EamA family transporter [Bacillus sp. (in: firmicutes)]
MWPFTGMILIFVGLFLLGIQFFQEQTEHLQRSGYYISLCCAIGFGLGQGLSKQAMKYMPNPFFGVFIGTLAALVCLTLIEIWRGRIRKHLSSAKTNPFYIWAGLLTSLALLFFYLSVSHIPVSYAVAILAIDPVLTVILVTFFLKKEETISKTIVFVTSLVFIGAVIISLTGS